MKYFIPLQFGVLRRFFLAALFFPAFFTAMNASEAEAFVGTSFVSVCPVAARVAEFRHVQDCIKSLQDSDPSNEVCWDVVEMPISTRPALFANYQAKRAANILFTGVNRVFHQVHAELLAKGQEKLLKEGLAKSSQLPEVSRWEFLKGGVNLGLGVIKLPQLSFFTRNIVAHLSFFPSSQRICTVFSRVDVSCQRAPLNVPVGFYFTAEGNKGVASFDFRKFVFLLKTGASRQNLFLPVLPFGNQTIHEVALPPPQQVQT